VTVVGFDELPATLELIRDGFIAGSVSQAPERQGYEPCVCWWTSSMARPISDVDTGIEVIDLDNYTSSWAASPSLPRAGDEPGRFRPGASDCGAAWQRGTAADLRILP
jgi:hypothetical protein